VVFFSGFVLGAHAGGHHGRHHEGGDHHYAMFHRGGPGFPMGPNGPMPPWAPGGNVGPSQTPGAPSTTAPSRP
jgi:hypothetical protein